MERAIASLGPIFAALGPAKRDVFRAVDFERHPRVRFIGLVTLHLESVATHPTRLADDRDATTFGSTIVAMVRMAIRHLDRMEEGHNLPRIVEIFEVVDATEIVVRDGPAVHGFFSE